MSNTEHKNVFGRIIHAIVSAWVFIFGSEVKVEDFMKKHAEEGIYYANILRNILTGKWVDILKTFTPDSIDGIIDAGRARSLDILDQAIKFAYKGKACLDLPTLGERIQCIMKQLRESGDTEVIQNKHILAIASVYARISAEQAEKVKVTESMADTATQVLFYAPKIGYQDVA